MTIVSFPIGRIGRKALSASLFIVASHALSAQTLAAIYHVDPDSGSDANACLLPTAPCKTIQHAIDLSSSGDSIYLAPYPDPPTTLGGVGKPKSTDPSSGGLLSCLTSPVVFEESGITVGHPLTITGKNPRCTIIDGRSAGRLFNVDTGGKVKIKQLTLRNGDVVAAAGGAIAVQAGDLSLTRVTIEDSVAERGGAIAMLPGSGNASLLLSTLTGNTATESGGAILCADCASLKVNNTTVSDNDATLWGGAILIRNSVLDILRSDFDDNASDQNGGAVHQVDSEVFISESEFSGNVSREGDGGATYGSGGLTVADSTFAENDAGGSGGAVSAKGPNFVIVSNSTFSGNTATQGGAFHFHPVGANPPAVRVSNTTFIGNRSEPPLAQVFYGTWSELWIGNSIVELGSLGVNRPICSLAATTGENNRIGDQSCGDDVTPVANFRLPDNATGIDPVLSDNGGLTRTHAVLMGSNVIDAGIAGYCAELEFFTPLAADQRGELRPADGDKDGAAVCDIGAVEYQE